MMKCPLNRAKTAQCAFRRVQEGQDDQEGFPKRVGPAGGGEEGEDAKTGLGTMGWGKYREPKCRRSRVGTNASLLRLVSIPLQKDIQSLCMCNVISH